MAEAASAKVQDEHAPAPAAAAPSGKPGKDKYSLVIVVLSVVNLGVIGTMGYFLQKLSGKMHEVTAQADKILAARAVKEKAAAEPLGKEFEAKPMGVLYPLDSFLVNIASDTGPKFLQTQMEFELEDASVEEELARKRPAVRDAIIVLLSSRNFKTLREANGMRSLRQDLMHTVNNLLTTGKVKDIYFTQFHFN